MRKVGLRVDADTFKGTKEGTPHLLELLAKHGIKATFFFCLGPDNMGRHLWRMLRPSFLHKMIRSKAASLYGLSILAAGTAWPGRRIAPALGHIMRQTAEAGHEVGLHAWDHQSWQAHIGHWSQEEVHRHIEKGIKAFEGVFGNPPVCSAAAGWRSDQKVAEAKEHFNFHYNSDCRGEHPFRPLLDNGQAGTAQIPVSLPTFDEVAGLTVLESDFNAYIIQAMLNCPGVPVYTIHTEVEGLSRSAMFAELLGLAAAARINFCPLGQLLPDDPDDLPIGRIKRALFPGREGWLGIQAGPDHKKLCITPSTPKKPF